MLCKAHQKRMPLGGAERRQPAGTRAFAARAAAPRADPHPRQSEGQPNRRSALGLLGGAVLLAGTQPAHAAGGLKAGDTGDWSSPGLAAPIDPSQPKFFKTDSGVRVQVLAEGAGPAATAGDTVLVDFVLRRSNGYFIYGTVDGVSFQPKDVPVGPVALKLGDSSTVPGLEDVLVGARPGSKFRALVPPELGYQAAPGALPQMPTFATKRQLENHKAEPLLFEVQLLRVAGVKR
ncbi:hypothetical protein ABPG77_003361 [Micractinium sp. CCAP 211/92]